MNTLITELAWWQAGLLGIYCLYTLIRAFWYFNDGVKDALIGRSKSIKLYHILWGIIDIPAMFLGKLFPMFKKVFAIDVIPLKQK